MATKHRHVLGFVIVAIAGACAPSPQPTTAPVVAAPSPCPTSDAPSPAPLALPPASAPPSASSAGGSAAVTPSPSASVSLPYTIGAAKGGPAGQRPCEFHESVDTYARTCTIKKNGDGSLTVTAAGTALNPDNGFSFRMGGGPNQFDVAGQLDAFGICKGPFMGSMVTVLDGKKVTYEVRFRDHCMIIVR